MFYLSPIPKEIPYKLAGFTLPNEELWLERNTLLPPVELQKQIFPFIEDLFPGNDDWRVWIQNIMLDKPEEESRHTQSQSFFTKDDIPAMRLMFVLAHLRKVILQDAVVLMSLKNDVRCQYSEHHVLKLPVFRSELFQQFSSQLLHSIQIARSPLSDSLTANAPAIQQEFRQVKTSVASLHTHLEGGLDSLRNNYDTLQQDINIRFNAVSSDTKSIKRQLMLHTRLLHDFHKHAASIAAETMTQLEAEQRQQDLQDLQQQQQLQRLHAQQQERARQIHREQEQRRLRNLRDQNAQLQLIPQQQGFHRGRDGSPQVEEWAEEFQLEQQQAHPEQAQDETVDLPLPVNENGNGATTGTR